MQTMITDLGYALAISAIEAQIVVLTADITALTTAIGVISAEVDVLQGQITTIQGEITTIQEQIGILDTELLAVMEKTTAISYNGVYTTVAGNLYVLGNVYSNNIDMLTFQF
jgi:prefoldin subunit 5